jgi:hypothetical protein
MFTFAGLDKKRMICNHVNELFSNEHGAVYQCNMRNCYWLDFKGEQTSFKVGDFLRFKDHVDAIDVDSLFNDASRSADFTILMPYRCNRCFILSALEVINLKELLSAARFMIELNSVLTTCLKARPSCAVA